MHTRSLPTLLAFLLLVFWPGQLWADVVETSDGSRFVGRVQVMADGAITIETASAGRVVVKQSDVTLLTTDQPVDLRLEDGSQLRSRITGSREGLSMTSAGDGTVPVALDRVNALWQAKDRDPGRPPPRRWEIEATVDGLGRTGNREQIGAATGLRSRLAGDRDALVLYTVYDRQVTDGAKSADQYKAGADYSAKFTERNSWYVRTEGGFDRVKDIRFYSLSAAGIGYSFIENNRQKLIGRVGISHRTENYGHPLISDLKAPGGDFGIEHSLRIHESNLVNRIAYLPSFRERENYRIYHESFLELPLAAARWKFRLGLSHEYINLPPFGVERLDTSYFTRLVLTWR